MSKKIKLAFEMLPPLIAETVREFFANIITEVKPLDEYITDCYEYIQSKGLFCSKNILELAIKQTIKELEILTGG